MDANTNSQPQNAAVILCSRAYMALLNAIKAVIVVFSIGLVLVVFSNVLNRFIFHGGIAWAEELARFLFIWLCFLGATLVNDGYDHMNLDFVVEHVPRRLSLALKILATLIVAIMLVFAASGGMVVVKENMNWLSPALNIPYGIIYTIAPICCLLMALQSAARIVRLAKELATAK